MRRSLLVVLALLAAACSSSDDGDDAAPEMSTTTSTTRVDEPAYVSEVYDDPSSWLCRGDVDDDPCDGDLDATVVRADGTTTLERFEPAAPESTDVDCFYVYPTISLDQGVNSDLEPQDDQEIMVVRLQAARLGQVCRVFAPVYRQVTLTSLIARVSGAAQPPGDAAAARETAYADVVDAFRQFVANDSGDRGIVLIGHSQGSGLLTRLLEEEVRDDPALRDRLVSALLIGSSVERPKGNDIPLCAERDDTGCIVTYATFRSTAPPPANSFFGRAQSGTASCTHPALRDGEALQPYLPSTNRSLIGGNDDPIEWAPGLTVDTPFVSLPDLVTARCVDDGTFGFLEVTVQGDPADPRVDDVRGDLTPEWGLHLVDVQLAMGDLVELVRSQAAAFAGSTVP